MATTNLLLRKLERLHPLTADDRELIERHSRPLREVAIRQDLIREGDVPTDVFLILSGFACRYKMIEGGRRQIMAFFVPGDFCDFQVFILKHMDHSIGTLSRCQVVRIRRDAILEMTERPAIARAFWWASLVDAAVLREWLVNIGQRTAEERIGHLLCELLVRLQAVGFVRDNSYALPISQTDLADALGVTVVHTNRMLAVLREQGLITLDRHELLVRDVEGLKRRSGFDPNYLHLEP
ncbi:Crp/Fnr family transcriptional regulator [Aureimonas sp. AU4]|uniref:Crp/Fnr family transcriptional regulator n=1 Tax=Aureimonas sp. AU4 TaxID=1638163 RepID=UPI000785DB77|nr:Crp/Fnr family transcriptional regulator [Aureimonas sp. AU4]